MTVRSSTTPAATPAPKTHSPESQTADDVGGPHGAHGGPATTDAHGAAGTTGTHGPADVHGAHGDHHDAFSAHGVKDAATRGLFAAESFEQAAHIAHNHQAARQLSRAATGLAALGAAAGVYDAATHIAKALESGSGEDAAKAADSSVSAAGAMAKVAFVASHANTALARRSGILAGAVGAKYAIKDTKKAINDIAKAVKTGDSEDIDKALRSSGSAVSNTAWTAKLVAVPTAQKILQHRAVQRAAMEAAEKVAPEAVAKAAGKSAAKAALEGGTKHGAIKAAAQGAAKTGAKRGVYRAAGKAAGKAALKAAGMAGAKGVGRFVPGLNVAIAVADTAQAVSIQRDPKASTGKKAAAWATAGLSAVAATNVPVVSQVAAGASLVTGFFRDLW